MTIAKELKIARKVAKADIHTVIPLFATIYVHLVFALAVIMKRLPLRVVSGVLL